MGQSILFCQCLKGGCGNKTHSHSLILSKWQRNKRIGPWNEPQWEPLIAVGWGRTISTCDLDLGGFSVRNSSFFFFVKPAYIFKVLVTKGCPSFFCFFLDMMWHCVLCFTWERQLITKDRGYNGLNTEQWITRLHLSFLLLFLFHFLAISFPANLFWRPFSKITLAHFKSH